MASSIVYLGKNVTEQGLQFAIDSLNDGDTLILWPNSEIEISKGLIIDCSARSITIDLNDSVLKQAGDVSVVTIKGNHDTPTAATLQTDDQGNSSVTYTGASSLFSVGDWIKIYSDDLIPADHGSATRMGQAMKVTAIDGDTLQLAGKLIDAHLYLDNVRVSGYDSGVAKLQNGTVQGDQSEPHWNSDLIHVRKTVDTEISYITVRDGNSMGINFVDTVNGSVRQSAAINLTDDTANGHYGYGVHSASSWNTTVNGFYAEAVRHAVDNNAVGLSGPHPDPSKYGADYYLEASNVVVKDATSFAFSWHSEGRYSTYSDSAVFDSYGVIGARGLYNTAYNIAGAGAERGVELYEYGDGDGRYINLSHLNLKELTRYAMFSRNDAKDNSVTESYFEVLTNKISVDNRTYTENITMDVGAFKVDDLLNGNDDDSRLLGGKGQDVIYGNGGRDYIAGGEGADLLYGGAGKDRFAYLDIADAGDTIADFTAGKGGDVIDLSALARHYGWTGPLVEKGYLRFFGQDGNTLVQVAVNGGGKDYQTLVTLTGVRPSTIVGDNYSTDIVVTQYPNTGMPADSASEIPQSEQVANPPAAKPRPFSPTDTENAVQLAGTDGNDRITGGIGNDTLSGGIGADALVGGAGWDMASYDSSAAGLTVNLDDTSKNTGDAAGDRYSQIEGLIGSKFDDNLTGTNQTNKIEGGRGNDVIYGLDGADELLGGEGSDKLYGGLKSDILDGGDGNDFLDGGEGYDTLTGGGGVDIFSFTINDGLSDVIHDFEKDIDKIAISRKAFGIANNASVELVTDARDIIGTGPVLIYNERRSTLQFDADGQGAGAITNIAMLEDGVMIDISDILLI